MLFFHLAYYALSLLIYGGVLYGASKLPLPSDLGAVITFTYGFLFLATPILIAVIMRFSLLKWYVDPFAAAEVPLFLYFGSVITRMNRAGIPFAQAFSEYNKTLSTNGEDWAVLIGLFLFGLAVSFSFARKRGESISYKLIGKFIA